MKTREEFEKAGYETRDGYEMGCGCCRVDFEVNMNGEWLCFEDGQLWKGGNPVVQFDME